MKKLSLVLLMAAMPVFATTIESGFKSPTVNAKQAAVLAQVVKAYGYACSSVSGANRSQWDGSFSLYCNNFNYSYKIKDVGGRIVVEVD